MTGSPDTAATVPTAPDFVTFTGVDVHTDLHRLVEMSRSRAVEWGILVSPECETHSPRYPDVATIDRFRRLPVYKAAHLCGKVAKTVSAGGDPGIDLTGFRRIQVNVRRPDVSNIAAYAAAHGIRAIVQSRTPTFPETTDVDILHDRSGGLGITPDSWPPHPGRLVGYAGGITPENLERIRRAIAARGRHWLDMETGIRTDDRLDLDKCEAILKAVYGG